MLLHEQRECVEHRNDDGASATQRADLAVPHVLRDREQHEHGRDELRLPHHIPDRLHVHRMHGEHQGAQQCGARRHEFARQGKHRQRAQRIEHHVREMEHERRPAADRPLHREAENRQRPVEIIAARRTPVRFAEVFPRPSQRVHARVVRDDDEIIVCEAVVETGRGGKHRGDDHEQPCGSAAHPPRLYRRICQIAATPSRQPIFLPSA